MAAGDDQGNEHTNQRSDSTGPRKKSNNKLKIVTRLFSVPTSKGIANLIKRKNNSKKSISSTSYEPFVSSEAMSSSSSLTSWVADDLTASPTSQMAPSIVSTPHTTPPESPGSNKSLPLPNNVYLAVPGHAIRQNSAPNLSADKHNPLEGIKRTKSSESLFSQFTRKIARKPSKEVLAAEKEKQQTNADAEIAGLVDTWIRAIEGAAGSTLQKRLLDVAKMDDPEARIKAWNNMTVRGPLMKLEQAFKRVQQAEAIDLATKGIDSQFMRPETREIIDQVNRLMTEKIDGVNTLATLMTRDTHTQWGPEADWAKIAEGFQDLYANKIPGVINDLKKNQQQLQGIQPTLENQTSAGKALSEQQTAREKFTVDVLAPIRWGLHKVKSNKAEIVDALKNADKKSAKEDKERLIRMAGGSEFLRTLTQSINNVALVENKAKGPHGSLVTDATKMAGQSAGNRYTSEIPGAIPLQHLGATELYDETQRNKEAFAFEFPFDQEELRNEIADHIGKIIDQDIENYLNTIDAELGITTEQVETLTALLEKSDKALEEVQTHHKDILKDLQPNSADDFLEKLQPEMLAKLQTAYKTIATLENVGGMPKQMLPGQLTSNAKYYAERCMNKELASGVKLEDLCDRSSFDNVIAHLGSKEREQLAASLQSQLNQLESQFKRYVHPLVPKQEGLVAKQEEQSISNVNKPTLTSNESIAFDKRDTLQTRESLRMDWSLTNAYLQNQEREARETRREKGMGMYFPDEPAKHQSFSETDLKTASKLDANTLKKSKSVNDLNHEAPTPSVDEALREKRTAQLFQDTIQNALNDLVKRGLAPTKEELEALSKLAPPSASNPRTNDETIRENLTKPQESKVVAGPSAKQPDTSEIILQPKEKLSPVDYFLSKLPSIETIKKTTELEVQKVIGGTMILQKFGGNRIEGPWTAEHDGKAQKGTKFTARVSEKGVKLEEGLTLHRKPSNGQSVKQVR